MKRPLFLGANWKMNPPPQGALEEGSAYCSTGNPEIVVFPTFIDLQHCIRSGQLIVGAQCGRAEPDGAYTGDISMQLLKKFGCLYVLCGHSERRQYHHEMDEAIAKQFQSAMEAGLIPILCIGETAEEREEGKTKKRLQAQLDLVLPLIKKMSERAGLAGPARGGLHKGKGWSTEGKPLGLPSVLIAYEPVWAIGTGKTPTPQEAEATHRFIRSLLPKKDIRILYGGSVTAANAASFFAQPDIGGALIGRASLKPEEFRKIVNIARS